MKSFYETIKNAKAGDAVLYKIGHRFNTSNLAPCTVNSCSKDETTVTINGSTMTAPTKHFYVKRGDDETNISQ